MGSMVENSELKKRALFTVFILLIYRFGTFVPIPGIDAEVLKKFFESSNADMLGMINLFSGGALERMSIFALNIMPYITASIIMQLLTSMYKGLEALKKEGAYGRSKINQYTRYLTIILAFFQSIGVYYALSSGSDSAFISDSKIFMWTTCISLVGGSVMLMWFGEKITLSGVGNGISLIIFSGIVSSLPSTTLQIFYLSRVGTYSWFTAIAFLVIFLAFLMLVSFMEKAQKRIKIQYPSSAMMRMSSRAMDQSFLPLKINISGVIPPIFASSILMFPVAVSQFIGDGDNFLSPMLRRGGAVYLLLFSALILFFSYFYSSIIFNTEEVANNLKKSNYLVLGVRPGISTSNYLDKIISRLTLVGALYLIFVCIVPEILITNYSIPLHIGGTGILIMVNVVLDLINQIQSYLFSGKYGNSAVKKRRVRVRA